MICTHDILTRTTHTPNLYECNNPKCGEEFQLDNP